MSEIIKFILSRRDLSALIITLITVSLMTVGGELLLSISLLNLSASVSGAPIPDQFETINKQIRVFLPSLKFDNAIDMIALLLGTYALISVLRTARAALSSIGISFVGGRISSEYYSKLLALNSFDWSEELLSESQANLARIQTIIFAFLIPLASVISSCTVVFCILIALYHLNNLVFLILTPTIIVIVALVVMASHAAIRPNAKIINSLLPLRLRAVDDIFGTRFIRKLQRDNSANRSFHDLYKKHETRYFWLQGVVNFLVILPKIIVEFGLVCAVLMMMYFILSGEANSSSLLELLTVLFIFLRTYPYISEIYFNFNKAISTIPQFQTFLDCFTKFDSHHEQHVQRSDNTTTCLNMVKKDVGHKIEIPIDSDEWVAITGPSGSGKSSLFNAMIYGTNHLWENHTPLYLSKCKIGYVPQDVTVIYGSVRHNLTGTYESSDGRDEFLYSLISIVELDKTLKDVSLDDDFSDFENKFSGGEFKRLALAQALSSSPDILFLDETLGAITTEQQDRIVERIRTAFPKLKILLITHRSVSAHYFEKRIELG